MFVKPLFWYGAYALFFAGIWSACQPNQITQVTDKAAQEWQLELDSLSQELAVLDKVAQTTLLRNYAGRLLDVGYVPESLNQRYRSMLITDTNVVYWYDLFRRDAVPTHCDVISKFYVYLLNHFGFKAANYTYGLKGTAFTHTVTAIDIGNADQAYIILQDPTLATLYLDNQEQAIHLPDHWKELAEGHPENIKWTSDTVTTKALVLPEAVEEVTAYLSATEGCEEMLADYQLKNTDGEGIKTSFQRHYLSWQNYCDRFDQRFLTALAEEGYAVDLRSALLVQAEVWGGDQKLIQYLQPIINELAIF